MKTWLVETIAEFEEDRNKASKEERIVHVGRVLPISNLKGSELAKGDWQKVERTSRAPREQRRHNSTEVVFYSLGKIIRARASSVTECRP